MASFTDLATIANNIGFQNRVRYAMSVAAASVYSEASSTAAHIIRANFAHDVTKGEFNLLQCTYAVLGNSTIAAEAILATTPDYAIPDSDIQFAVNSLWNLFAEA